MKELFFGAVILVVAGLIVGALGTGTGLAFDYENASRDERQAFLDKQAASIHKRGPFMLLNAGRAGSRLYMSEVVGKEGAKEVVMTITVMVYEGYQASMSDPKKELEALCTFYGNTLLEKNGIRLTSNYVTESGSPVFRQTASPSACERALKAA